LRSILPTPSIASSQESDNLISNHLDGSSIGVCSVTKVLQSYSTAVEPSTLKHTAL